MKSEFLYLHHIRERCERIVHCVDAGREKFFGDVVYQDAVMRNLEVIGGAAKRVSAGLRSMLPDLDWRRIAGLRDVIIHDYPAVEVEEIWNVASRDVPALLESLNRFLKAQGQI